MSACSLTLFCDTVELICQSQRSQNLVEILKNKRKSVQRLYVFQRGRWFVAIP